MLDLFIDLETTGSKPSSDFWEIGAVTKTTRKREGEYEHFFHFTEAKDWDLDTYKWAEKQEGMIERFVMSRSNSSKVHEVIGSLSSWVRCFEEEPKNVRVFSWGNFDIPILQNHLSEGQELPWHYRNEIDLRSVTRFHGLDIRPDTSTHNALADAQALAEFYYGPLAAWRAACRLEGS